jgi:hypothetical protein
MEAHGIDGPLAAMDSQHTAAHPANSHEERYDTDVAGGRTTARCLCLASAEQRLLAGIRASC